MNKYVIERNIDRDPEIRPAKPDEGGESFETCKKKLMSELIRELSNVSYLIRNLDGLTRAQVDKEWK